MKNCMKTIEHYYRFFFCALHEWASIRLCLRVSAYAMYVEKHEIMYVQCRNFAQIGYAIVVITTTTVGRNVVHSSVVDFHTSSTCPRTANEKMTGIKKLWWPMWKAFDSKHWLCLLHNMLPTHATENERESRKWKSSNRTQTFQLCRCVLLLFAR